MSWRLPWRSGTGGTGGGAAFSPTQTNIYPSAKDIFAPGTNITLTENDTAKTITINSTATGSGAGFDVGDNVPSTNPANGFHYIYSVAQSSLTTGKTFETAAGTTITAANAFDIFEWDNTNTKWILRASLPAASTTAAGAIEISTSTEATTGTDTTRAITPALLKAAIDSKGVGFEAGTNVPTTDPIDGFLYLYTTNQSTLTSGKTFETAAGTALTSANVYDLFEWDNSNTKWIRRGFLPIASATQRGISELATATEASTGTDTSKVITPATLKNVTDLTSQSAKARKLEWEGGFNPVINSVGAPKILNVAIGSTSTAWAASTAYAQNVFVTNNGNFYKCNTSHTSSAAFATDANVWDLVAGYRAPTGEVENVKFGNDTDNARISFSNPAVVPDQMVFEFGIKATIGTNYGFWIALGANNPSVSGNESGVSRGILLFILTQQAGGRFAIDIKRGNSSTENIGTGGTMVLAGGASTNANNDRIAFPDTTSSETGEGAAPFNFKENSGDALIGIAIHEYDQRIYTLHGTTVKVFNLATGAEYQSESFTVGANTVDIAVDDEFLYALVDASGQANDKLVRYYRTTGTHSGASDEITITNQNGTNSTLKALDVWGTRAYVLEEISDPTTYALWAASTVYALNAKVISGTNLYTCSTAHTSSASFATDSANWTRVHNSRVRVYRTDVSSSHYQSSESFTSTGADYPGSICRAWNNHIYVGDTYVAGTCHSYTPTGTHVPAAATDGQFDLDVDSGNPVSAAATKNKIYILDSSTKVAYAYQARGNRQIKFVFNRKKMKVYYDGQHMATYTYSDARYPFRRNSSGAYVNAPGTNFILQSNADASGFEIDISNMIVRDLTNAELNSDWGHTHAD